MYSVAWSAEPKKWFSRIYWFPSFWETYYGFFLFPFPPSLQNDIICSAMMHFDVSAGFPPFLLTLSLSLTASLIFFFFYSYCYWIHCIIGSPVWTDIIFSLTRLRVSLSLFFFCSTSNAILSSCLSLLVGATLWKRRCRGLVADSRANEATKRFQCFR